MAGRGRAPAGHPDLGRRRDLGHGGREHHPGPGGRVGRAGDLGPGRVRHRRQAGRAGRFRRRRRPVVSQPDRLDPGPRHERRGRLKARCSRSPRARTGSSALARETAQGADWSEATGAPGRRSCCMPLPSGATGGSLQQVAINGANVVALGQATTGHGPAIGSATGTVPGAIPFAELSANDGQTWQQMPFQHPGPDTSFTALAADGAAHRGRAVRPPGPPDVALSTSANSNHLSTLLAGIQRPQRIGSLADRRAGPVFIRGHRHRHHRRPQ